MMMIKLLHQLTYYTILLPVCLGFIIIGFGGGSLRRYDNYYYTANDFLNKVKGKYQEIGT